MAANIQPLADYVVVQQEEAQTKTASGLFLPEQAQEKPDTAVIVAVGEDVKNIKVGDKVLYIEEYGRSKVVTVGKESYTVIKQDNIVAVVKG